MRCSSEPRTFSTAWQFSIRGLTPYVLALGLAACGPQAKQYPLEGQVLAVRPETQQLLIKHGDIPNFMPGMTMAFRVAEPGLLDGRVAGDLVKATLNVSETDAWISTVEKTGTAPLPEVPAETVAARAELLEPGATAPDTALTDERGQALRLSAWRGSAVAVTFIYTRCPLPQYCPMLDRRFEEVQRLAKADAALAGRIRLLSVSFDPDADTPPILTAHARKLHADPEMWRFATAPRDEVDRFAVRFGVNVIRETDGTITHNMRTAVIDPAGRVTALLDGSQWTAPELLAHLRDAAAGS
jgi:protein SCO1/2